MRDEYDETTNYSGEGEASDQKKGSGILKKVTNRAKKILGIVFLLASLFLLAITAIVLSGRDEKAAEVAPQPIDGATAEDVFVSDKMSYMTDVIASFAAKGDRQFYLSVYEEGEDFHITAICLADSELEKYEKYIEYGYSADMEAPEILTFTGHTKAIDSELKGFICEALEYYYGIDTDTAEMIYDIDVLPFYVVVGGAGDDLGDTVTALVVLGFAAVFFFVALCLLTGNRRKSEEENGEEQDHVIAGILAAILGASIAGIIWMLIGMGGYICVWAGMLMIIFSYKGYSMLCDKHMKFAIIFSFILSMVMVAFATFMVGAFSVFKELNDGTMGFVSLTDSMKFTFDLYFRGESSGMLKNILIGEVFVVIGGFSLRKKKSVKVQQQTAQEENSAGGEE